MKEGDGAIDKKVCGVNIRRRGDGASEAEETLYADLVRLIVSSSFLPPPFRHYFYLLLPMLFLPA